MRVIRLITGDFGSGKTTALFSQIRADITAGREALLLVPEQETVSAEQTMAALLPPAATLLFEVSNFSHLANTVFRRLGGLSYRYADLGTRTLCMWRTMGELLPLLHEKEGAPDLGRVRRMTAAMRELSALSITPVQLDSAAKQITDAPRLREKLEDLSLIATLYRSILHEKYDDTAEDLDRLCELLAQKNPLAGMHIYVDGFTSFTRQQWRVLRALGAASELTFALTLPAQRQDNPVFLEGGETYAQLCRLAQDLGTTLERCDLGAPRRAHAPILRRVLCTLFDGEPTPEKTDISAPVCSETAENPENTVTATPPLRILAAENAMTECEWIASDITRRVMEEGARYRDFAIIARHADSYVGVLDTVFADAGIPIFLSRHTDISAYAAIKLIYTAYAVCIADWRQGDVISYCKCGLSGIPQEDIDIFELYVTRWRINGSRFTSDAPWTMNPDGYTATLTPRSAEILSRAEKVRAALLEQLSPLAESCRRQSVREHARALYLFLSSLDLENKLRARAEEANARGDRAEAEELSRLFAVICEALDRLVDTVGDSEVDAKTFTDLLRLLFGEVSLSRIPSALDEVTVGSADIIRIGRAKHVYLIGVNEGEFPAYASGDSIFTDGDRRVLSSLGLAIEQTLLPRAARELFCFARAFAAASESVSVLYANKTLGGSPLTPASVLENMTARFGIPITELADLPAMDRLWTRGLSRDSLGLLQGSAAGAALATALAEEEEGRELLRRLCTPLVEADCHISPQTAEGLFGKRIRLSQSRINSFTGCPFAYFCRDVLRLDPAEIIEFGSLDIGSLLHAMLEEIFARLAEQGKRIGEVEEEELLSLLDSLLEGYVQKICPGEYRCTARFSYLIKTLRRSLIPVLKGMREEFSQSRFYPTLFEWSLNGEGKEEPFCTLSRGDRGREIPVLLGGRIDRVDTWEQDGKTYFRVVDYKTGGKTFTLDGFDEGREVQLLLYLFSLWKGDNPALHEKIGQGTLGPAGVMYAAARAETPTYDAPQEATRVEEDVKRVSRSGLFLNEESVLRAMDPTMSGRYIPIRLKKDGDFDARSLSSLVSEQGLEDLYGRLQGVISRVAENLISGEASARPLKTGRDYACKYCEMASVCRFSKK